MRNRNRHFTPFPVVASLIFALLFPAAGLAEEEYIQYDAPILMRLVYKKDDETKEVRIPAVYGNAISPAKGLPQRKWRIEPGENLTASKRPGNRLVALYTGTNNKNRVLLCLVYIRYFKNKTGSWTPFYRIGQQHLVVRRNGRWTPITGTRGASSLIVITGNSLPNIEGFYPKLSIGLGIRKMQIDSWFVR